MKERSFIDTNILVYTDDADSPDKCRVAIDLVADAMRSKQGVISTQILQEYYAASTRKLAIDPVLAKQRVQFFLKMHTVQITPADVLSAIDLHRLHALSFWDALVVHAARQAKCTRLLSEDMNHGQVIEGIQIINPFE
jgi:predicted nucleic acid-binding protein